MDDPSASVPARRDNAIYLDAIEGLRADVREDIGHLRDDVREDVRDIRVDLSAFITAHGREHADQKAESETAHDGFTAFISNFELERARKDGALGVFRFVLEQLSRHARPLAALGIGLITAIAAIVGAFRVDVVVH